MSIYHEDFDGGGGGEGTFKAYGGIPFIDSNGNPGNCARFGPGQGYYRDLAFSYANTRFTLNLKVAGNFQPAGQLITMNNASIPDIPSLAQPICNLHFEPDRSISVYISGRTFPLANTQTATIGYSFGTDEWFDLQWLVQMSDVVVGISHLLRIKTSLSINGTPIFIDVEGNTDINPLTQPSGSMGSNNHLWQGPGGGAGFVDNIVVESATSLDSSGSIFETKISQAVLEVTELPTDAVGTVSQGVIEITELPEDSSVIITQAVIELVGQVVAHGGGGWRVYEA